MQKLRQAAVMAVFVFLGLIATAFLVAATNPARPVLDDTVVKVQLDGGHGSGVVIGDGTLILTAAHVAKGAPDGNLTILTRDGQEIPGRVLWIAKSDDVALIQIDTVLPAAVVQCEKQQVGDRMEIVGHPAPHDTLLWMHTYAQIGAYYDDGLKYWKAAVMIFGGEVYSGSSGGPAFNQDGEVIAIVVAMSGIQVGFGQIAPYGFNLAVPAWRICEMFP